MNTNKIKDFISKNKTAVIIAVVLILSITIYQMSFAGKSGDGLDKIIKEAISDNIITRQEWYSITSYILLNQQGNYADYISNKNLNISKVKELINSIAISDNASSSIQYEFDHPSNVKIYLDNTPSMDAFINSNSTFTPEYIEALSKLIESSNDYLQHAVGSNSVVVSIQYINSSVSGNIAYKDHKSFFDSLNFAAYRGQKTKETRIDSMLDTILTANTKDDISVFISDSFYSLDASQNTNMQIAKDTISSVFKKRFISLPFSTIILKMKSRTNGKYYDTKDVSQTLTPDDPARPYYIWILGSNDLLVEYLKSVEIDELSGIEAVYYLSDMEQTPFYAIVNIKNDKGESFSITPNTNDRSISNISSSDDNLIIPITIDLNSVPIIPNVASSGLVVEPAYFQITSIELIDNKILEEPEQVSKTTATHILKLNAKLSKIMESGTANVSIEIPRSIPAWVRESSSNDEKDYKKTYGLEAVIEGVYDVYQEHDKEQTSCVKININVSK